MNSPPVKHRCAFTSKPNSMGRAYFVSLNCSQLCNMTCVCSLRFLLITYATVWFPENIDIIALCLLWKKVYFVLPWSGWKCLLPLCFHLSKFSIVERQYWNLGLFSYSFRYLLIGNHFFLHRNNARFFQNVFLICYNFFRWIWNILYIRWCKEL